MSSSDAPLSIGMVIFPNMTQLDFTGPYEVFTRIPDTHVIVLAKTSAPVRSQYGLAFVPDMGFDGAPQVDIMCVPGGPGVDSLLEDGPFLDFLKKQGEGARFITSVCTGSLLLAAAGLLKGYRATTHWQSLEILESLGVQTVRERVVKDRNRITGGGVTAGIDFGLVIAAELRGERVAQAIQLAIEYNPSPPFQSGSPQNADPAVVEAVNRRAQESMNGRREIVRRILAKTPDSH